jgi:anti-sigma factor RsiW
MSCPKYERWISDRLDGALSGKREKALEAHLQTCESCRAFGRAAQRVQKEVKAFPDEPVPEAYWEESLNRLSARLASQELRPAKKVLPGWGWKWAWLAAPLLLAAVGALLIFRQPVRQTVDDYLNAEERMGAIYSELSESPDLEQAFNQALESSIQEGLSTGSDVRESHLENPLLYRVVSDEEMGFLLQELKKELTS